MQTPVDARAARLLGRRRRAPRAWLAAFALCAWGCSSTTPGSMLDGGGDAPVMDAPASAERAPADAADAARAPDAGAEAGADAGPDAGPPGPPPPAFFLQLSDVHIGGGSFARPALEYTLGTVLPAFGDATVLVSGDLVETGNEVEKWVEYRNLVDGAGLTTARYVEVPGNHDTYLDSDLGNYLAHSVAGRAGGETYGVYRVGPAGRRVRVVALNTSSAGDPVRDSAGYLAQAQVDDVRAIIAGETEAPAATIIIGHHPPAASGLALFGTDDLLRALIDETQAVAYLFGHLHVYLPTWTGATLMVQSGSHGMPPSNPAASPAGFSLVAIDDGPVVKYLPFVGDATSVHLDFPVVMITRPANPALAANLAVGDRNPWGTGLPRGAAGQVARAGVFADGTIDLVELRLDGGPPRPMTLVAGYYEATFDTPDASTCHLEVRATAGGRTASDAFDVPLL